MDGSQRLFALLMVIIVAVLAAGVWYTDHIEVWSDSKTDCATIGIYHSPDKDAGDKKMLRSEQVDKEWIADVIVCKEYGGSTNAYVDGTLFFELK